MKLFKKILCGILSATMLIISANISVMAKNDVKVVLDGKTLSFDVPPQIIDDRTMVPVRAIFEALNASVNWDQKTKTVTSKKGNTKIELTIDSKIMYVNSKKITIDAPACIVDDRTLVPLRAISEAYDIGVDWNAKTKTVVMYSEDIEDEQPTPKATPKPTQKPKSVSISSLKNIGDSFYEVSRENLTDLYGNTYIQALYSFHNRSFQTILNGEYTRFTCTLYSPADWCNSDDTTRIIITADGDNIYTSPIITKTSRPIDVDVDITGCNDFQIKVDTDGWHEIGLIADGTFYR